MTDLVYMWVDGADPAWRARKAAATGIAPDDSDTDGRARYVSNDELRYSLRSAARFAPWIRRVFIVTDRQTPEWLDTTNPRVRVVDHSEILPPEARPCFNSNVIEYFLYRIPGLAPRFLLANDDMFFGAPVSEEFFFAPDGLPIVRLKRRGGKLFYRLKKLFGLGFGLYRRTIYRAALLVERRTGKFNGSIPHHNIDAYLRDDVREAMEEVFGDEVRRTQRNRTRAEDDLQRAAISLWAVATGRAHLRYVRTGREGVRLSAHKRNLAERIERLKPSLFCLNDSHRVTDADRARIAPFLQALFPEPSEFEAANAGQSSVRSFRSYRSK